LSILGREPIILLVDLRSLEIKVSRSENLPVLPQIVSQVLTLADDPNASTRSMERLIEADAAIAAKILRVSSSAFYGSTPVPTIGRAISILGMNTIRALVVGIAYQQIMGGRTQSQLFSKLDFWRHCLATAISARVLGKILMPSKADDLYCAGMLHDVGILVLDRFAASDLDSALKAAMEGGVELHEAEDSLYGYNHAMIGDLLAVRWNLSPIVHAAIRYHHDVCGDDHTYLSTCIVAAANHLAHRAGFKNAPRSPDFEIDPVILSSLNLPEEQYDIIVNVLPPEVQKAEQAFGIS